MPFVNIKLKGPQLTAEQSKRLHDGVGQLIVDVLGKSSSALPSLSTSKQGWIGILVVKS